MLIVFILAALVGTAAVAGLSFWLHGSLVAFLIALFTVHAVVFVLAVTLDPNDQGNDGSAD